jgi:hypothetical protein
MQEPAARKTITKRRRPSPSTARKKTGSDSRGPDPAMLSAPPKFNGACVHLVDDTGEDFFLLERWRVMDIVKGGFNLSYDIAYVGHVFNASFSPRTPLRISCYILPDPERFYELTQGIKIRT